MSRGLFLKFPTTHYQVPAFASSSRCPSCLLGSVALSDMLPRRIGLPTANGRNHLPRHLASESAFATHSGLSGWLPTRFAHFTNPHMNRLSRQLMPLVERASVLSIGAEPNDACTMTCIVTLPISWTGHTNTTLNTICTGPAAGLARR
ncbi:unnamed protein product [Protopolystoma xenopodis]|uniref:Uncharacterized protein n=1 Tax=Protopolystoma xenopodis TaxID=117903 RepID=A0A448WLW6_9PLAT|nr:unnamed protein product [Protopolystoma xenopodis]